MQSKSVQLSLRESFIVPAPIRSQALQLYRDPQRKSIEIAAVFGVSPSALTVWAKQAGLPLRSQGRRPDSEPSERSRRIIHLALKEGQSAAAAHFGVSRSRVCAVMKRWRTWVEQNHTPNATDFESQNGHRKGKCKNAN